VVVFIGFVTDLYLKIGLKTGLATLFDTGFVDISTFL